MMSTNNTDIYGLNARIRNTADFVGLEQGMCTDWDGGRCR
jgi:hypothetical protein